jgi:hypothetical protein
MDIAPLHQIASSIVATILTCFWMSERAKAKKELNAKTQGWKERRKGICPKTLCVFLFCFVSLR